MKYLFVFLLVGLVSACVPYIDGQQTKYYKNGQIKWINSPMMLKEYYKNGQIKIEFNYKDGKEDGLCREWYENGQIKREWTYKEGHWDGLCREWYIDGRIKSEKTYSY